MPHHQPVVYIYILTLNRLINAIIAEDNKIWSASNDFIIIHDAEVIGNRNFIRKHF